MTGPPFSICALNSGTTEPAEPSTLPKRTAMNRVLLRIARACRTISATRLDLPMIFAGLTALSVDIMTKRSTP